MHTRLLFLLLLLASCSGSHEGSFSTKRPGLDVADVALANGAPETTLHIAQQILATDPHNVPALVRAGMAQAALDQRDQARRSFDQALALSPNDDAATLGAGRLELATDPAAAADRLLRLTKRDPHNVAALIDLGIAKDLLGQHADAQRAYRSALVLEPDRIAGQVNLGLSLAVSGDPQQALKILRPLARGSDASPRIRQDLAVALALAGDDEEAASVLHTDIPRPEALTTVTSFHMLQATR